MKADLSEIVRELMDFIEENNLCDEHHIDWITDIDYYIKSERSTEMKELLQKVEEALGEE